ncbi:DUF4349 domain-containing protein [Amorphoplanes digitatis]|uniref:DUF4349 domain-containing protein n=1 Tax=Actinoplanes digitatis TaxID=1868 RepID=A0A7W7HS96_9ACTN|nr:DUF4349 domain-containing protein [Actinoplanes digitatis]MBB4759838.1 hypothetical protein [Actinoplanes digitatis]GID94444.1 hypothetical protein Adi01nite_38560 [Actinoplanes digitatis]
MRAGRKIAAAVGAVGLALTLALAGCGGSGGSDDTQSTSGGGSDKGAAEAPAAGAPEAPREDADSQGKDQTAQAPNLAVDQRSIIYTGSITVRVDDVNISAARASGIATAAGGFVSGDKRNSGSGSSDASLELRVPTDKFSTVVTQLAELGDEEQRGINTEDVTEAVIDLDARIATQKARVESGRKLLAQAKSLNDLVMLEREVATREADLASLEAKKRRLADLTSLSTITVILLDPEAVANQPKEDGPPGFLAGLENGWKGLLTSLGVLVTIIGWLLPWLIAIGLPAWAIVLAYRRYRRSHPASPPRPAIPAFATHGPPPGYPVHPHRPAPPAAPQSAPPAAPQSAPPATPASPDEKDAK